MQVEIIPYTYSVNNSKLSKEEESQIYFEGSLTKYFCEETGKVFKNLVGKEIKEVIEIKIDSYYTYNKDILLKLISKKFAYNIEEQENGKYFFLMVKKY